MNERRCPQCDTAVERLVRWKIGIRKIIMDFHRRNHLPKVSKGDDIRWNFCKYSPCLEVKELLDAPINRLVDDNPLPK